MEFRYRRGLVTLAGAMSTLVGCAPMPGGLAPFGTPYAGAGYPSASYAPPAPISCPSLAGVPSYLRGPMMQQCRSAQDGQRQAAARYAADQRRANTPHLVSANYIQPLTPATDLAVRLTGKTITEQAPVVTGNQVTDTKTVMVYLARNGTAYTPVGSGRYSLSGGQFCVDQACQPAFYDASGALVLMNSQQVAFTVTEIVDGDAHGMQAEAERSAQQARRNRQAAAATAAWFLTHMGDGGGSSSGGSTGNRDCIRNDLPGISGSGCMGQ